MAGAGDAGDEDLAPYRRRMMVLSDRAHHDELWTWVPQWLRDDVDFVAFVGECSSSLFDSFIDVCVLQALDDGCDEPYFIFAGWFATVEDAAEYFSCLRGDEESLVCVLHGPT
ncbi:hypothetical protein J5226_02600 [Lysobacter sp. K5869]|uniref:hypothetical protein n=1 Tax=Lysobacter sp. K5869 TaxID=2820808 RepID=UPI001C060CD4|nr:hypothetical protein [Lysobacter sp. K5869]QWP77314.1 hypothetical protein J5226_02600 [Lysobacter sp. K5869]